VLSVPTVESGRWRSTRSQSAGSTDSSAARPVQYCHSAPLECREPPSDGGEATGLFLAEKYVPAKLVVDLAAVVEHDRAAARVASIRHIRTTYVPGDETCFSLFEAPSLETIQRANARFELGYRRVTAVFEIQSTAGGQTIEGAMP
jgi:hypothetical protein